MDARTFVVDGATSGLGLEIARLLAAEHQTVVLGNAADEVAVTASQLDCEGMVCDVSKPDHVARVLGDIAARYGAIDGLAHCAGVWAGGPLQDISPETIRRTVEVNVLGTAFLMHEAIALMREQGCGNLVYIGAIATEIPRPGIPLYRATKSFGSSLVESLAEAQGSNSIKVMEIHPGPMHTRLQERAGAEFLDQIYALPEQVAPEAVRLLTLEPDELYVSGQKVLRADGRW
jgi:NAD(P)-dependent dehydrogenase (short-subunit alcohol dehydrogenase family)